jgi:hypothetical protein
VRECASTGYCNRVSAARIRDFAVYIAVGVAFVLLIAWSVDRDIEFKWIGLVFETCLVFGCAVWDLKRYWRSLALWSALFLALVVHLAGSYLALLARSRRFWI